MSDTRSEPQPPSGPAAGNLAAFRTLFDRALEDAVAPPGLHERVRQLVRTHRRSDTTVGCGEGGLELLTAVVETALRRVQTQWPPGEPQGIASIIDRAALEVWGDRPPSALARLHFYRLAAEVMRRTLRHLALRHTEGPIPEVWEPVNRHGSLGQFDAAEVLLLNEWWDVYAAHYGERASLYALQRFAGRSVEQLVELVGLPPADVDRHLGSVRQSIQEFRVAPGGDCPAAGSARLRPADVRG